MFACLSVCPSMSRVTREVCRRFLKQLCILCTCFILCLFSCVVLCILVSVFGLMDHRGLRQRENERAKKWRRHYGSSFWSSSLARDLVDPQHPTRSVGSVSCFSHTFRTRLQHSAIALLIVSLGTTTVLPGCLLVLQFGPPGDVRTSSSSTLCYWSSEPHSVQPRSATVRPSWPPATKSEVWHSGG